MNFQVGAFILRRPELYDLEQLYKQKNSPEIAEMLGGFSIGYSIADLKEWLEYHRQRKDEALWIIAEFETNRCVGQVGLYKIDHRVRNAEFGIIIGDRTLWGKGLGHAFTKFALNYGFQELNLNRIYLTVLETNMKAIKLYRSFGFREEGRLRQAQYRRGMYVDVIIMGLLRLEYEAEAHV